MYVTKKMIPIETVLGIRGWGDEREHLSGRML
jgi:hypothetical protein